MCPLVQRKDWWRERTSRARHQNVPFLERSSSCDTSSSVCVCLPQRAAAKFRAHQRRPPAPSVGPQQQRQEAVRRYRSRARCNLRNMSSRCHQTAPAPSGISMARATPRTSGDSPSVPTSPSSSQRRNATGTAIWTAANGDQIRASVVGHGDLVFPIVTITETHTITSGTGRFADASGTIRIERVANILTGVSSGSLSGTINLGH